PAGPGRGGGGAGRGGPHPHRRGGAYVRGRRRLLPGEPGARPADRAGGTGARRAGDPRSAQPDGGAGSGRGGREHREAVPREAGRDRVSRRLAWTVPRRPLHPDRRDRDRRCGSLVGGGRRVRRPRERARRRRGAADAIRSRTDLGRRPAGRRPRGRRRVTPVPDVIALGETMRSVITVHGQNRDHSVPFVTHGGAESNACVTLVRLGFGAAWVSRLGTDAAGDFVMEELRAHGVDLRWVRRDPERPTGSMFRETMGGPPIYERAGSAASALEAADLDGVPGERG